MRSDENSTTYSEISITQPPENVLEQFIVDLRVPIRIIEDSLPDLLQITEQDDGEATFSQLGQALRIVNENIQLVIDYLNSRVRNGVFDTENVAERILCNFTHELREYAAPLGGIVAVCQQIKLSKDRLKNHVTDIEGLGNFLTEVFKILEKNWQTWLLSGDFDWGHDDKFESYDDLEEQEQQASQGTITLPEDRWRNAGLLDK